MDYRFRELSVKEFEQALEAANFDSQNFLQSPEMYQRYQNLGKETYLVGLEESATEKTPKNIKQEHKNDSRSMPEIVACGLIVARPWHFGKKIFKIAGGPLLDYDSASSERILTEFSIKAQDFIAKKGGITLEISPNIIAQPRNMENQVIPGKNHLEIHQSLLELGYKYLGEYEQAKWLFVLNLQGRTEQEIWDSLRVTHRRMLRKAEREGVEIREMTDDELPLMKEILAETGSRQGFFDPSLEYYRSMKQAFGEKVKFMLAEREGEPLAVAMYIIDEKEMIYLYGGSRRAGQKYAGSYQMQWEMIKEAIKRGIPRYNFYGTKPIAGNGVYQFKQGFRGTMEELLGTFALPVGWLGKLYVRHLKKREIGELR